MVLTKKWFPHETEVNADVLGEALFLERDYWDKFQVNVCNAIVRAFNG